MSSWDDRLFGEMFSEEMAVMWVLKLIRNGSDEKAGPDGLAAKSTYGVEKEAMFCSQIHSTNVASIHGS